MDKTKRKELKEQYKAKSRQKYLLNLVENNNLLIGAIAQIELGKDLPEIDRNTIINATYETDLSQKVYFKILEKAYKSDKKNKTLFNERVGGTIEGFSDYLKAIYHSYLFESAIAIGDIDKEFTFESDLEEELLDNKFERLIAAYKLMNNDEMLKLIEAAKSIDDYDSLQEIAVGYNPQEMDNHRLEFIKKNWKEFELK